jgi:hypothetical protein
MLLTLYFEPKGLSIKLCAYIDLAFFKEIILVAEECNKNSLVIFRLSICYYLPPKIFPIIGILASGFPVLFPV